MCRSIGLSVVRWAWKGEAGGGDRAVVVLCGCVWVCTVSELPNVDPRREEPKRNYRNCTWHDLDGNVFVLARKRYAGMREAIVLSLSLCLCVFGGLASGLWGVNPVLLCFLHVIHQPPNTTQTPRTHKHSSARSMAMYAPPDLEAARRTQNQTNKVRFASIQSPIHSHSHSSTHPRHASSFVLQLAASLLTGQRPDALPCLGPGAGPSCDEATYLALLAEKEMAKEEEGTEEKGEKTTHTVPPTHLHGLLRQEIARQKELVSVCMWMLGWMGGWVGSGWSVMYSEGRKG